MNEHLQGKDLRNGCLLFLKHIIQKILLFFRQKSSPSSLKPLAPLIIPVSLHDNTPTHPRERPRNLLISSP